MDPDPYTSVSRPNCSPYLHQTNPCRIIVDSLLESSFESSSNLRRLPLYFRLIRRIPSLGPLRIIPRHYIMVSLCSYIFRRLDDFEPVDLVLITGLLKPYPPNHADPTVDCRILWLGGKRQLKIFWSHLCILCNLRYRRIFGTPFYWMEIWLK